MTSTILTRHDNFLTTYSELRRLMSLSADSLPHKGFLFCFTRRYGHGMDNCGHSYLSYYLSINMRCGPGTIRVSSTADVQPHLFPMLRPPSDSPSCNDSTNPSYFHCTRCPCRSHGVHTGAFHSDNSTVNDTASEHGRSSRPILEYHGRTRHSHMKLFRDRSLKHPVPAGNDSIMPVIPLVNLMCLQTPSNMSRNTRRTKNTRRCQRQPEYSKRTWTSAPSSTSTWPRICKHVLSRFMLIADAPRLGCFVLSCCNYVGRPVLPESSRRLCRSYNNIDAAVN